MEPRISKKRVSFLDSLPGNFSIFHTNTLNKKGFDATPSSFGGHKETDKSPVPRKTSRGIFREHGVATVPNINTNTTYIKVDGTYTYRSIQKLDILDGDEDSQLHPESLKDLKSPNDDLESREMRLSTQRIAKSREGSIFLQDQNSSSKKDRSFHFKFEPVVGGDSVLDANTDGRDISPGLKAIFSMGKSMIDNEKESPSASNSSANLIKRSSIASPSYSPTKTWRNEQEGGRENESRPNDGEAGEDLTRISKRSLEPLKTNNIKGSYLRFLPYLNDMLRTEETPGLKAKDIPSSPYNYDDSQKAQERAKSQDLSISFALKQLERIDKNPVNPMTKTETEKASESKLTLSMAKRLLLKGTFVFSSLLVSFVFLAAVAYIVTYPFEDTKLSIWINDFFHGLFLSSLPVVFLKAAVRIARNKSEENEINAKITPRIEGSLKKEYNDTSINLLSGVVMLLSGLVMALTDSCASLKNPFYFVIMEAGFLVVIGLIFCLYIDVKNKLDKKKSDREGSQGFFKVRVYKNFMNDLYTARRMLSEKTNETNGPSPTPKKVLATIREEGIDRYKSVESYDIVTTLKVLGSQGLIIVAYIQLIVIVGLVKLYDLVEADEDNYFVTIPILLAYPAITHIFTGILDIINSSTDLGMQAHAYYLSSSFAVMFWRMVLFNINDLKPLWVMIVCKALYKVFVFLILGVKIDFWRIDFIEKVKLRIFKLQIEYQEPEKCRRHDIVKMFALGFILMELSSILYNIMTLLLVIIFQYIDHGHFLIYLKQQTSDNYITATWIEIAFDVGLLVIIGFSWSLSQIYRTLPLKKDIKHLSSKPIADFLIISFIQLIIFFYLLERV